MTREDAIKRLKEYAQYAYGIWHNEEEDTKAFDMAIEALSQPIITKCYEIDNDHIYCSPEVAEKVVKALKDKPQGEWEKLLPNTYCCTNCGRCVATSEKEIKKYNFCPNCGADMRGGTE